MINNVVLIGRLTKDADLKYTASGKAVASFTLAVNRTFKGPNGEQEADFIQCVAWGKTAETLSNYTHKGSLIGVTGRIQTRSYENNQGQRVYVTEVVVTSFTFLEKKQDTTSQYMSENLTQGLTQPTNTQQTSLAGVDPIAKDSWAIDDSDMPF